MKDKQRKPETQLGFASFSMQGLAEAICGVDHTTKPIQHDKARTNRTHKQRTK